MWQLYSLERERERERKSWDVTENGNKKRLWFIASLHLLWLYLAADTMKLSFCCFLCFFEHFFNFRPATHYTKTSEKEVFRPFVMWQILLTERFKHWGYHVMMVFTDFAPFFLQMSHFVTWLTGEYRRQEVRAFLFLSHDFQCVQNAVCIVLLRNARTLLWKTAFWRGSKSQNKCKKLQMFWFVVV